MESLSILPGTIEDDVPAEEPDMRGAHMQVPHVQESGADTADARSQRRVARALRRVAVFAHLPDDIIERWTARAELRRVEAGEQVFAAGHYEADDIYGCIAGKGQVTLADTATGSIRRHELSPGEVFGLDYVLAGMTGRAAEAGLQALERMDLVVLDADAVREAISGNHQAAAILLREMARKALGAASGQPGRALSPSARICEALYSMAARAGDGAWHIAAMPRHRELAAQAGTSEKEAAESVAGLIGMHVLKRNYPGMLIIDHPALLRMASAEA